MARQWIINTPLQKRKDFDVRCFVFYVDLVLFCTVSEFLISHLCDGRVDVVSLTNNLPDLSFLAASRSEIGLGSRGRAASGASCPWL